MGINLMLCVFIFAFTALFTAYLEKKLIPILENKAKQPIYEGGPSWHSSKSGTPTMGGLAFVLTIAIIVSVVGIFRFFIGSNDKTAISLFIGILFAIGNAIIGVFDDLTKLRRKENAGLTPIQKLLFQFLLAIIFLMARAYFLNDSTSVSLSFGKFDLGAFYYPLAILMLVGIVNCANLTDGIDGLATSVAWMIGAIFFIVGLSAATDGAILSSALMGGTIAFLFFNVNPAKVFMGDTGSLFLGALVCAIAFTFDNPFALLLIGIIYVIEGASVILQVLSYKLSGKRIFKMAPLHHHLEQSGYRENTICIYAIIVTLIFSIPALLFLN